MSMVAQLKANKPAAVFCLMDILDCSRYIISQNNPHQQKILPKQQAQKGRQAGSMNVPALSANIFAMAVKRTNIQSKTGGMNHKTVFLIRYLWYQLKLRGISSAICV
jgi:hypothetical protein